MDVSDKRIIIVGKTGVGQSSLANTIFGEKLFKVDRTFSSVTKRCRAETRSVNGRRITLIDTSGFFDTDRSEEEMKPEIVRCITECAPGPHAFLIVLKVDRFTEQEQAVIDKIRECFSEQAFKYATVVFTHGDQLPEGQIIEQLVLRNKSLSDLVRKCGGRCHVVDNKYWEDPKDEYRSNRFQVEELLKTIDRMVTDNNGSCYTNEMLQEVEEEIQQEEENVRLLPGDLTQEEIREEAKSRVYKVLIRLAGIGTGALLGALLGATVMVGVVVAGLKVLGPIRGGAAAAAGGGLIGTGPVGAVVGTSAAVGAVIGGVKGYYAAEGADTAWEAAKRTAEAVKDDAKSVYSQAKTLLDKTSQPKSKMS